MNEQDFSTISYESAAGIARITMRRPSVANALNSRMIDELDAGLSMAETDPDVRVVVLFGEGKHFCSGHDLKELFKGEEYWAAKRVSTEGKWEHETEMYLNRSLRWRNSPLITIAAVQGTCSAAGLMLACMCDMIVASEDAEFSNPVLRMSGAGVELLVEPWEMGARRAKEFLFCARKLSAAEAESAGLVNRVVAQDELNETAMEMAGAAALVPPITAKAVKESINHTLDLQGQAQSWQHHFALHQLVSATDAATSAMKQRTEGGMSAVKDERSGTKT